MNRLACIVVGCLLLSVFLLRCICLSVRALWLASEFESDVQRERVNTGHGLGVEPFTTCLDVRRVAQGEKAAG